MATVSDTDRLREPDREPRLALSLAVERTVAGSPSVAELGSLIGVTMLFELATVHGARPAAVNRPLAVEDAHSGRITALAVVEHDDEGPVIISAGYGAGDDWALRNWRLDGSPGELAVEDLHVEPTALVVVEHDGAPLVISASYVGALRSWCLDGSRGPLEVPNAHRAPIQALVVVEDEHGPLIVSAGDDGALRSWRPDGSPGELAVDDAHQGGRIRKRIMALVVVEHDGAPLIVSGGDDGALRSWRLDGSPGELAVDAHPGAIMALVVVEHDGAPLIISGGDDGALRSRRLNGSPGELAVDDTHELAFPHAGETTALVVVEHDGAPLIISGGDDGALRSWRLDGSRGPLDIPNAHTAPIQALVVVEHSGAPLIISGGNDGALRSWRVAPGAWARLGGPLATQLEVRRVSFGSPLELEVLVPAMATASAALAFVLYAFKRLWTFRVELRIHTLEMRRKLIETERELERLEATGEVDDIVEAARDAVIEAWRVIDATLSAD